MTFYFVNTSSVIDYATVHLMLTFSLRWKDFNTFHRIEKPGATVSQMRKQPQQHRDALKKTSKTSFINEKH